MNKKKNLSLLALVVIISVSIFLVYSKNNHSRTAGYVHRSITLENTTFDAFVSDTEALRANGLSNFPSLASNQTMLFVFPNAGSWGFWMKDMLFPLDIVWLDQNGAIVSFEENISPATYPNIFFPKGESLYVLEFPAGTVKKIGAKVGDKVILK